MRVTRKLHRRCRRVEPECTQPVLGDWLHDAARLSVNRLDDTPVISVDLELTGLNPEIDRIIAVGWTEIHEGRIRLGTNRHLLVCPDLSVGNSAVIHELRDHDLAQGVDLSVALEALFRAARGKLFLFHHAALDCGFLQRACRAWAGCSPPIPALDTLRLEAERRHRRGQTIGAGDLRLDVLRAHYGLPRHQAHNALADAVATAELFLAMLARAGGDRRPGLTPMLRLL